MKNLVLFTFLFVVFIGCKKEENLPAPYVPVNEYSEGYNLLLIGNSFFRPYAEKLDVLANEAGFVEHNSTRITRGGDNGRPINFWNDSLTQEHFEINHRLECRFEDFVCKKVYFRLINGSFFKSRLIHCYRLDWTALRVWDSSYTYT